MTRLRLMLVLPSPVRGGVEEVALALARGLDRADFRLAMAAPRALLDDFGAALPPDVEALPVQADSWSRRDDIRRLGGFVERWQPHVVNPHLFRATWVAAPVAKWHGVRVVETYHGREVWRAGVVGRTFVVDQAVALFVDRAIAVSEAARRFLVHRKRYPAHKVVVVPNGRDLSRFRPGNARESVRKELGLDHVVPVVGVFGRLSAQKGHAHLLDAWPAIVSEFPDARLLVVGDGELRATLERRAAELGIVRSLVFTGFRHDVPRLLDGVDVVALPSLYEGMPLTVIEAAAMARPVVATAVDGTPEVVRDGRTGRLVPPADAPALARALAAFLRDPDAARRMGQAARDFVLDRFDLDTQIRSTARVYLTAAGVHERRVAA